MNKRKIAFFSSIIVSAGVLSACGDGATGETEQNSTADSDQKQEQPVDSIQNMTAKEPAKDETCIYCEMDIPHPEEEGAPFTAQAITQEGERVFFDDSGCLENAEADQEFAKVWVKDYDENEWVEREGTTVVYDESLKTPMSYHYAIFDTKEDAQVYVEEHGAELASWDDVQKDASERAKNKGMNHGDKDSEHEGMEMEENDHDGMVDDEHMDEKSQEHSDESHTS